MKGIDFITLLAVCALALAAGCIVLMTFRAMHDKPVPAELIRK